MKEREDMVIKQIEARGVKDPKVLEVMRTVPRHEFTGKPLDQSYGDRAMAIGHGQTISQPYIVALLTELLKLEGNERVLEIGTGSGYQAAVLAKITPDVFTLEIVPELQRIALERLKPYGLDESRVLLGDGHGGLPDAAPFDRIIATAAPEHVPKALFEQLRPGGRMVVPVGHPHRTQNLKVVKKGLDGSRLERDVAAVVFVPFTGGGKSG